MIAVDDPVASVPEANLLAYSLFYHIETALRELIVEEMERHYGPRWWRQRVPGDVATAMNAGRQAEQSVPWLRMVPHHPIYYAYFPHLKQIVTRADNWRDVFGQIFGYKDRLDATLAELEQVRNKIAHNRKIGQVELEVVRAACAKMVSTIGEDRFSSLVSRCTSLIDVPSALRQLKNEASVCASACASYEPLPDMGTWSTVEQSWWFDDDYLGGPIDSVRALFSLFHEYEELPRVRGSGYMIERWVTTSALAILHRAANDQLEGLIREST